MGKRVKLGGGACLEKPCLKKQNKEKRKEGKREEKIRIIRQMIKEGLDETLIHRTTRCTREEFSAATR